MKLLLSILFVVGLSCSYAQQPTHYILGEEELSGIDIYDLLQDSKGNYWIASDNGIYKYDGYDFVKIECEGMMSSSVFNLTLDYEKNIFCNNLSGQIFIIKKDTCKVYYQIPDDYMHHEIGFQFDNRNELIISTKFLFRVDDNKEEHLLFDDIVSFTGVPLISEDSTILLYDGLNKKAMSYKNGNLKIDKKNISWSDDISYRAICMLDFNQKMYWFDRKNGNVYLEGESGQMIKKKECQETGVLNYFPTKEILWKPFLSGGVDYYDFELNKLNKTNRLFSSSIISAFYEDQEGNIIFGTFGEGLFVLPNKGIIDVELKINDAKVSKIVAVGKSLYIGTQDGKTYQLDENNTISLFQNGDSKFIEVLEFLPAINSFIIDGENATIVNKDDKSSIPIPLGAIKDVTEYKTNSFLVSMNSGLYEYKPLESKTNFKTIKPFTGRVNCAAMDVNSGEIYAGTSQGLKIGDSTQSDYFEINETPLICQDIIEYDGKILISTQKEGVLVFSNGQLSDQWTTERGLFSDNIKQMIEHDNKLYLSTLQGINVLNLSGELLYSLNKSDGLSSNQIIDFDIGNGWLWILHNKGIQKVKLENLEPFSYQPSIEFSRIEVNGEALIKTSPKNIFNHKENKMSFFISSTSLKYRNEIQYYYTLEGAENQWFVNNYADNIIEYKSLSPGEYVFKVFAKCRNNKSEVVEYAFTINKPYWQTLWFLSIIALMTIGLTIFIFRYQFQKQRKKSKLQSELISSKLRAIQSQMNPHFIFNSLNSIQDLVLQQDGKNAYRYISKFALLVRQILNHSEKEFIDIEEEFQVLEIYLDLENLRFKKDFSFEIIQNDISGIEIPPMIIQPFVENALKHGLLHNKGEKKVSVKFELEEDSLTCTIEDNGIGRKRSAEIKQRQSENHDSFSVKSIRSRFEILKGVYGKELGLEFVDLYEKENPAGTRVIVNVPFKRKY